MRPLLLVAILLLGACGEAGDRPIAAGPTAPRELAARPDHAASRGLAASRGFAASRGLAGLAVRSDPAPAYVFLDGVFMGETAPEGPLVVTRAAGEVELRVACPDRGDGIYRLRLEPGEGIEVMARLTRDPGLWDRPTHPVRIGPGQDLRGAVLPGADGPQTIVYEEEIEAPCERILVVVLGAPEVSVLDPRGETLRLREMPEGVEGAPGHRFLRVEIPAAGRYRLVVGGAGGYILRWMKGLPPLAETDDPGLRGRRLAPESIEAR